MHKPSIDWTDELRGEVLEEWNKGVSAGDIAKTLSASLRAQVTRNAVIGQIQRLKERHGDAMAQARAQPSQPGRLALVPVRSASPRIFAWDDEKDARLREMWAADMLAPAIAAKFGIADKRTVIGRAKKLGLPNRDHLSGMPNGRRGVPSSTFNTSHNGQQSMPPKKALSETPHAHPDGDKSVRFDDLAARHCRFEVTGATAAQDMRFCGHRREVGGSYCAHHAAVAFKPRPAKSTARAESSAKPRPMTAAERGW